MNRLNKQLDITIPDRHYQKLEEYLKNGQWEEADNETYRVMIEVLGKEQVDWFRRAEELLNFPCEDLLTIDGLWVQHSQGKFGFSVQKEIIKKCGYKLDGSYPGDEIWYEFLDKVGWRDKKTHNYSDPTYNDIYNVKNGTLPFLIFLGRWDLDGWVKSFCLFSRIETCRL